MVQQTVEESLCRGQGQNETGRTGRGQARETEQKLAFSYLPKPSTEDNFYEVFQVQVAECPGYCPFTCQ